MLPSPHLAPLQVTLAHVITVSFFLIIILEQWSSINTILWLLKCFRLQSTIQCALVTEFAWLKKLLPLVFYLTLSPARVWHCNIWVELFSLDYAQLTSLLYILCTSIIIHSPVMRNLSHISVGFNVVIPDVLPNITIGVLNQILWFNLVKILKWISEWRKILKMFGKNCTESVLLSSLLI